MRQRRGFESLPRYPGWTPSALARRLPGNFVGPSGSTYASGRPSGHRESCSSPLVGGSMDEPLFPVVDLEQITSMSDEDIQALIDQYNAAFGAIASGAAFEGMEDPPDLNERKALALAGAETLKTLKAALAERTEERERYEAEMAEIAADAGVV